MSSTRAWRAATGDESERADYRAEVVWDVAGALQPASAGPVHVQTEGLPVRKPDQCDSTIRFGRSVRLEALKPISRLLSSRNALRILMVDSPRHYIFVITLCLLSTQTPRMLMLLTAFAPFHRCPSTHGFVRPPVPSRAAARCRLLARPHRALRTRACALSTNAPRRPRDTGHIKFPEKNVVWFPRWDVGAPASRASVLPSADVASTAPAERMLSVRRQQVRRCAWQTIVW